MRVSLLVLVAVAALVRDAGAQALETPRHRQGYYFAVGLGGSMAFASEEGAGLGPLVGAGLSLRVGELVTPRIGLGTSVNLGGGSGDGESTSLVGLGIAGQLEVAPNLALHLGVGLGITSILEEGADADEARGGVGPELTVGVTYDWFPWNRRSGGWAFTPGVWLRAVPGDDLDVYAITLGVEVTRWTGRPRSQLALPEGEAYRK